MSPNVPWNVPKHSGECPQTFQRMSSNIPENVAKHSRECRQTYWEMSPKIPGNDFKHIFVPGVTQGNDDAGSVNQANYETGGVQGSLV